MRPTPTILPPPKSQQEPLDWGTGQLMHATHLLLPILCYY